MWFTLLYLTIAIGAIGGFMYLQVSMNKQYYVSKAVNVVMGKGGLLARFILWTKGGSKKEGSTAELKFLEEGGQTSCCFTFDYDGLPRTLFVPIHKSKKFSHNNKTIKIVKKGESYRISHPPGFEFRCKPCHLGGESIIVSDLDSGEENVYQKFDSVDF